MTGNGLENLITKTEKFMKEMELSYEVRKDFYVVKYGSTAVIIEPRAWEDGETYLKMRALVLTDVLKRGNETMFEEFSEVNSSRLFATIYWGEYADDKGKGNVWLRNNLLGDTLDFQEFKTHLSLLALAADDLDDKLKQKYGGETCAE